MENQNQNNTPFSKIFCLVYSPTSEVLFIGKTNGSLKDKWIEYKRHCGSNSSLYQFINDVGWCNIRIDLLENIPYTNEATINTRELFYINLYGPTFRGVI